MKRFTFTLRPVAVLRAHAERRARELLAVAVGKYVKAEESLALARSRSQELERILFAGRRERFRASDEASFFHAYRKECAVEIAAQKEVIVARTEMENARRLCIEANKALKVIGKLEEHARASYRVETLKSEQAEFDEMATQRIVRRQFQS